MAVGHYNDKRYWEALEVINSAIQVNRYYPDFWYLKALICERLSQYEDVVYCYLFVYGLKGLDKKDKAIMKEKYVQAKQKLNQSK